MRGWDCKTHWVWRFGDLKLDPVVRELRRGSSPVHLEPQAFDLLVYLVEHRDRVVPKAELLDGVWGHRFLSEASLTTRVKEVRHAVGDDGKRQHTIKNIRGRGYRFVAEVNGAAAAAPSGLVGRDREITEIKNALTECRIVTLVGPGGVGKSALARAVAEDSVFVDLAVLAADAEVLPAVARAAEVVHDSQRPDDAIRGIATLKSALVLDNCEHVADAVRALVDQLVQVRCGSIGVLATSQVPLGADGETIIDVEPLAVDDARALFVLRGRAARRSWGGVDDERVDRLVAALERLPLPIEMAAARIRSMSFDDLERVVVDHGTLPVMTHRTTPARHRSLESIAAWSAGLLEPAQRRLFTEFAVFAGPVGVDDAAAVLAPGQHAVIAIGLADLADRSLLVADVRGPESRYRMLATVRTIASQWLDETGAAEAVRERHALHVVAAVRQVDDRLRTSQEGAGRRRLAGITAEIRAAHHWARQGHPALADELSGALFLAAYSSLWNEPAEWSETLLAVDNSLAGAAVTAGGAAAHRGDIASARAHGEAAASAGTGRVHAGAVELLADVALYEGDLDAVAAAARQLLRLGDELGDRHVSTFGVVNRALARAYAGDPASALTVAADHDESDLSPSDTAWLAYTRGEALGLLGDDAAAHAFTEAIDLGSSVDNLFVECVSRISLANERARAGHLPQAFADYAEALSGFRRHGNHTHALTAVRNLITLLDSAGDDRGAATLAGAVADDSRHATYGTEALRVRNALAAIAESRGQARLQGWLDEGRARRDDVEQLAIELITPHRL